MITPDIIFNETLIYCSEPQHLPGRVTTDMLRDWRNKGLEIKRGPKFGQRVTLDWAWLGGRPVTSLQAFARFQRQLNGEEEEGE